MKYLSNVEKEIIEAHSHTHFGSFSKITEPELNYSITINNKRFSTTGRDSNLLKSNNKLLFNYLNSKTDEKCWHDIHSKMKEIITFENKKELNQLCLDLDDFIDHQQYDEMIVYLIRFFGPYPPRTPPTTKSFIDYRKVANTFLFFMTKAGKFVAFSTIEQLINRHSRDYQLFEFDHSQWKQCIESCNIEKHYDARFINGIDAYKDKIIEDLIEVLTNRSVSKIYTGKMNRVVIPIVYRFCDWRNKFKFNPKFIWVGVILIGAVMLHGDGKSLKEIFYTITQMK